MMYPHGPCTLKQKQLIRKLYDDLGKDYPDFDQINREQAHRIISNTLHELKLPK